MADDFESGTRAAAFGGNTTVLPFCLQQRGQSLRQAVRDYHAKADGNCYIDVSFHLIISDPTEQVLGQELPALIKDGYTSFKVFMTYEDLALSDRQILEVMSVARETGGPRREFRCHPLPHRSPGARRPYRAAFPRRIPADCRRT